MSVKSQNRIPKKSLRGTIKTLLWVLIILFVFANIIAYNQAYQLTHFTTQKVTKTAKPEQLSPAEKIKTLFTGVSNPRPENKKKPDLPYTTIKLQSNKKLECWFIKHPEAKGTVIMFHGYSASKSGLINKANIFYQLGYSTMLVDFMGSGGSEGNETTIGFAEAEEVKTVYQYVKQTEKRQIILFGTSMGAVATMKALNDFKINPAAIIMECPYSSLLKTTQARFKILHIPAFPLANILVFWGGFQHHFNGFKLRPVDDAKSIKCSTLLLYGEKDTRVSRNEINEIFNNLKGIKTLRTYPLAGHDNYLTQYKTEWTQDISLFLKAVN
ncbi:2-succinyl-6-hydroxy-2,4-cyclohexadiene-1-carboxylate synthase [compost metagenome]